MRARRVKGVKPADRLDDAAQRIVTVRLQELHCFIPAALDPAETDALHDLRIAAKRLRYVLEITSAFLGAYAHTAGKRAKELQDLLGEIHDCDELAPRVRALQEQLREQTRAEALRQATAAGADDLDPALTAQADTADAWRGLETLGLHLEARRAVLHGRFLELWRGLEREGFRARLEYAITERSPEETEDQEGVGSIEG